MEMGPDGVNVNAICPGSVKGPRIDGVIERDAQERGVAPSAIRDVYLRQSSMRVFVDAKEIADTVKFLCSPAGHNISGQALAIDGHTEGLSNWID
jgi:NAD(P)-dependent dehydrogenase (short-subunit alcohol dehydrogenase family)